MRKKLIIELIIYVVIVVLGIAMLLAKPLDNKNKDLGFKIGGVQNAIISLE